MRSGFLSRDELVVFFKKNYTNFVRICVSVVSKNIVHTYMPETHEYFTLISGRDSYEHMLEVLETVPDVFQYIIEIKTHPRKTLATFIEIDT